MTSKRVIATIHIHQDVIRSGPWHRNWYWLETALNTIACEIEKGEHRDSTILAIYEAHPEPLTASEEIPALVAKERDDGQSPA